MKKNPFIARLAILTFTLVASSMPLMAQEESMGIHQALKTKFVEGNAGFMSLVAIALVDRKSTRLNSSHIQKYLVCRLLLEKTFFNDTATTEIYTLSLTTLFRSKTLLFSFLR